MFSYCGLVTESFPCVIWPLLKKASKESLDRSITHNPEGEAGHCGHAGDGSSRRYSVEIHLTQAQGLWQPRWLPHTRKGSHTARELLPGQLRTLTLLLRAGLSSEEGLSRSFVLPPRASSPPEPTETLHCCTPLQTRGGNGPLGWSFQDRPIKPSV